MAARVMLSAAYDAPAVLEYVEQASARLLGRLVGSVYFVANSSRQVRYLV